MLIMTLLSNMVTNKYKQTRENKMQSQTYLSEVSKVPRYDFFIIKHIVKITKKKKKN